MPYSKLLKNLIEEKDMTYKELSTKCNTLGQKIDPSYISKIISGKASIPSDDISKALAEALDEHSDLLVLEALLDKAPNTILDFLNKIKFIAVNAYLPILGKDNPQFVALKHLIDSLPLSKFILEVNSMPAFNSNTLNIDSNEVKINYDENTSVSFQLNESFVIPITDDSMEPILPKGSKVSFKNNYENGDIVIFTIIENKEMLIRRFYEENDLYIFTALNAKYKPLIYKKDDIEILGKVNKATIDM